MLKHLYKTLLISVISGSLLSFSPAIALAADGQTQTTTDSNGVITAKKSYKFDKISDADMMASIGMLAAGFITGRMVAVYNKPISMDAMIAGAAGVAFIAGEITTNIKFKGKIDEMTVEVEKKNDGTVNEEQVKRLEDLKKSYEEAKKTTNIKKMLQLAAAAGYGAAAATAGYFAYAEWVQIKSCTTALTAMQANCGVETSKYLANMTTLDTIRQYPKPSSAAESSSVLNDPLMKASVVCIPKAGVDAAVVGPQLTAANAVCPQTVAMLRKHQVFTYYDLNKITNNINESVNKTLFKNTAFSKALIETPPKSYFEQALDLFISKADASWIPFLGLSAGVAGAFAVSTFAIAKQIDLWIYVPFNRSIIFGVLSGIALLAAKASASVMDKLDANIAKIDAILADLNKLSKGVKAQNLSQQGIKIATVNPLGQNAISFSTDNTAKTDCMTNNSSENCKPLANQLTSMPGFSNLPDSFKDIATQTVAVGDGLSGATGISGSTLSSAESLGSKQNAIAKLLKSTQDRLNLVSKGKLNTDKAADKFSKGMAAVLKKSLERSGMTATGLMAAIGSTPIDSSLAKKDLEPASGNKLSASTNAVNIQDGAGSDKDAQSLKLDFKEQTPGDGLSMGEVTSSGGAAKEYDIKSPEINGEFGPTLFELISGRYIKSGYPKLLEEEPSKN